MAANTKLRNYCWNTWRQHGLLKKAPQRLKIEAKKKKNYYGKNGTLLVALERELLHYVYIYNLSECKWENHWFRKL